MARLYKTQDTTAQLLVDQLLLADSFWARAKGLLGQSSLSDNEALWINPCNNIHTFFMKFPIDCIFVDRKMQIQKLVSDIRPFKIVGPFWKSHSVIEARSGFIKSKELKIGDHLYVVN